MRNFCELKEHVVAQWKETKNFEKRIDKMLTRIHNIESNINELTVEKHKNFAKCAQVLIAELVKQKKGYQSSKTSLMK